MDELFKFSDRRKLVDELASRFPKLRFEWPHEDFGIWSMRFYAPGFVRTATAYGTNEAELRECMEMVVPRYLEFADPDKVK